MATTTQENKELVQRFIREANDKNYDQVAELFTAGYTRRDPDTPGDERGPEPFVEVVAFEGTMTGTHEGEFRGIEPTGEAIEIPGNAMHRISDGRIAETWATWNFLGALEQLGVTGLPRG